MALSGFREIIGLSADALRYLIENRPLRQCRLRNLVGPRSRLQLAKDENPDSVEYTRKLKWSAARLNLATALDFV